MIRISERLHRFLAIRLSCRFDSFKPGFRELSDEYFFESLKEMILALIEIVAKRRLIRYIKIIRFL